MRTLLESSVRSRVLKIVASVGAILLSGADVLAGPVKIIKARASGQVVSQGVCSATEPVLCQVTHVTGTSSVLGTFDGVLSDHIDSTDGTFNGTGVFTMSDGSTITTEYTGQVGTPLNGVSPFIEFHTVSGGTGKYDGASGTMTVTGTVDGAGHIEIVGVGTLDK